MTCRGFIMIKLTKKMQIDTEKTRDNIHRPTEEMFSITLNGTMEDRRVLKVRDK